MSKNFNGNNQSPVTGKDYSPKKDCKVVAIDTNVFIDISHMKNGEDYKYIKNNPDARVKEKLFELKKMADDGKVKFVILPTVFNELNVHGMSKTEKVFMRDYCVLFVPNNKVDFARKSVGLSRRYIGEGVMKGSKTPYGDAIIMAEASLSGLNLLTNNYKDFVLYDREKYVRDSYGDIVPNKQFYKYDESAYPKNVENFSEEDLMSFLAYKQRDRALDIASVNEKVNCAYEKNGFKIIPMPFTSMDYVGRSNDKSGLCNTKQFDSEIDLNQSHFAEYAGRIY